jgi:hypothetical protein
MRKYTGPILVRHARSGILKRHKVSIPYDDVAITLIRTGEKINGRIFNSQLLAAAGSILTATAEIKKTPLWGEQVKSIRDEKIICRNLVVQGLPADAFLGIEVKFPFKARLQPRLDDDGYFIMDTPYGEITTKNALYRELLKDQ